jgi:hypothetical protein
MTGWTDEARQASIESRAGGVKPGDETHNAAIKGAQKSVPAGIAAAFHNSMRANADYHARTGKFKSVPSGIAARYHSAVAKMNEYNSRGKSDFTVGKSGLQLKRPSYDR